MLGKKLLSGVLTTALLGSQMLTGMSTVSAQSWQLSLSQAGITSETYGGSSWECLPATNNYSIKSVQPVSGGYEVKLELSSVMNSTIQPNTSPSRPDVNRWKDSPFKFMVSDSPNPSIRNLDGNNYGDIVQKTADASSGTERTFMINTPQSSFSFRNTSNENETRKTEYLVMYPTAANMSYFQGGSVCSGFVQSWDLTTSKSISLRTQTSNTNVTISPTATNQQTMLATVEAGGATANINGTTVSAGNSSVVNINETLNTITDADGKSYSFYKPHYGSSDSCLTPNPFSTLWSSNGNVVVEMYPSSYSNGTAAEQYLADSQYRYAQYRFVSGGQVLSPWTDISSTVDSNRVIKYELAPMPGATSIEFITAGSFSVYTNQYGSRRPETKYCSQIDSIRSVSIPEKPVNLVSGLLTKEFMFVDKTMSDILLRAQSLQDNNSALRVFAIHTGGQTVNIAGQDVDEGGNIILENLGENDIIDVVLPSEPGFSYSFVRPVAGELLADDYQRAQLAGRESDTSVGVVFKKTRYSDNGTSRYKARYYTHYRYETLDGGMATLSDWVPLVQGTDYPNVSSESTVKYTLNNVPGTATAVDFTAVPSARAFERYGDESGAIKTWHQMGNIERILLSQQAADIANPVALQMTIAGETNGFLRSATANVTTVSWDDVGVTQCLAGLTNGALTALNACSPFVFDFNPVEGAQTLYFQAQDAAGKLSNIIEKTVNIDLNGPVVRANAVIDFAPVEVSLDSDGELATMNWTRNPINLDLSCTDTASGCMDMSYGLYQTMPANCNITSFTYEDTLQVDARSYLCVKARDNAGRVTTYGPIDLKVDNIAPIITSTDVTANDPDTTVIRNTANQKWYTSDRTPVITVNVSDTLSGANGTPVVVEINNVRYSGSDGVPMTITNQLPDGEYNVRLEAQDAVGNPALPAQLTLVVDTTPPATPLQENFIFETNEDTRGVTFNLPSPQDAIGIDHLELSLTQNGVPFPITEDYITLTSNMTIVDGVVIINKDANGAFPTTVTLTGLPPEFDDGAGGMTQAEYVATLTIVDFAGNQSSVDSTPITYDTQSPTATLGAQPDTVLGSGTEEDPFLVGDDNTLPLTITITEPANNSDGTPSVPITVTTTTPGVTIDPNSTSTCESVDDAGQCVLDLDLILEDGFTGAIDLVITDGAGNSTTITVYAEQSSTVPTLPDPAADTVMTPATGTIYSGTRYTFALSNITGATDLDATLTYTDSLNQEATVTNAQTVVGGTATFTFTIGDIAEGTSTLSLVLSNEYGNTSQPITYTTTRDTLAPLVSGFTYAWEDTGPADDDAQLRLIWTEVSDASAPVRLEYEVANDGVTFGATQTTDTTGITEFTIPGLADAAKVRTRFVDSGVTDFDGNTDDNTTADNILGEQDVIFGITDINDQRGYELGYILAQGVDVSDFRDMDVTLETPITDDQNTTISTGNFNQAGATIFTEDPARLGTHTARATLNSFSKGLVTLEKIFELADRIDPVGILSLSTPAVENNGQFFVSLADEIEVSYGVDATNEDSFPVTVSMTMNGADIATPILADGTLQTVTLQTPIDGTYDIEVTYTDGAGNTSEAMMLSVVRDSTLSIQSVRLLDSSGTAITTQDTMGNLYTKEFSGLQLEVISLGDTDTYSYFINDVEVTNAIALPTSPAGTQGVTIPLADIADNDLTTLNLRVEDSAGNPGNDTVAVRVDNLGPNLAGALAFPANAEDNPIVLSGFTATDFSAVRYRVDYTNGTTASIENPFNNSISLAEEQNVFTLTFLDALGNESQVNNGEVFTVFMDSLAPVAEVALSTTRTAETTANLTIGNITEIGDTVNYTVTFNGVTTVATGAIDAADYATSTEIPLDLTSLTNFSHTVVVRLTDSFNNATPYTYTLVQDMEAPSVAFTTTDTINMGASIGWAVTISDALSAMGDVTGRVVNETTGQVFQIAAVDWRVTDDSYVYGLAEGDARPGHTYTLYVTAQDELGNGSDMEQAADPFDMPTTAIDEGDPLNDGPTIDPEDLSGDTLTVQVTNNNGIDFTVTDVPVGEQIILSYILDLYNAANPGSEITKLPIGEYDIIVTDNQGNSVTYPYTITPYYTDVMGDLNGDGFGGGLIDHKIYSQAKENGVYDTTDTDIQSLLSEIDAIIATNIETQYAVFLAN